MFIKLLYTTESNIKKYKDAKNLQETGIVLLIHNITLIEKGFIFLILLFFLIVLNNNNICLCQDDGLTLFSEILEIVDNTYNNFDKTTLLNIYQCQEKGNLQIINPGLVANLLSAEYIQFFKKTQELLSLINLQNIPDNLFFLPDEYIDVIGNFTHSLNFLHFNQCLAAEKILNCYLFNNISLINYNDIELFIDLSKKNIIYINEIKKIFVLNKNLLSSLDTCFEIKNISNIPLNFEIFRNISDLNSININLIENNIFKDRNNPYELYNAFKGLRISSTLNNTDYNFLNIKTFANIQDSSAIIDKGFIFKL